jgi:hypothetical protein
VAAAPTWGHVAEWPGLAQALDSLRADEMIVVGPLACLERSLTNCS